MQKISKRVEPAGFDRQTGSVAGTKSKEPPQDAKESFSSLLKHAAPESSGVSEKTGQHVNKGLKRVQQAIGRGANETPDARPGQAEAALSGRAGADARPGRSQAMPRGYEGADTQSGRSQATLHGHKAPDARSVQERAGQQAHEADAAQQGQTNPAGSRIEAGKQPREDKTAVSTGDQIDPAELRTLQGAQAQVTDVAAPAQVNEAVGPAQKDINEIVRQIADRVFVSAPDSASNPEVRIQLKGTFMDGSDVRIFREAGELQIVFVAQTKDAENFIARNQEFITQALGDRLKDEQVRVSVETQAGQSNAGSQDNEGRSRQQYVADDDQVADADNGRR